MPMDPNASAAQRAYDHVRTKLENGELQPGTRLVTRNLAHELGMSLNPVREALNRLASQRLLTHIPGARTFVHRPDAQEIRELYGLREAIESYAAAEAALHRSETDLETLEEICAGWRDLAEEMRGSGGEALSAAARQDWIRMEERFHRVLVDAGRNRLLSRTVADNRVLATVFQSHRDLEVQVTVDVVEQVHTTHSELVDSFRRRDSEAARQQMAALVKVGCHYVLKHMAP